MVATHFSEHHAETQPEKNDGYFIKGWNVG
jgi:hypothetical protein